MLSGVRERSTCLITATAVAGFGVTAWLMPRQPSGAIDVTMLVLFACTVAAIVGGTVAAIAERRPLRTAARAIRWGTTVLLVLGTAFAVIAVVRELLIMQDDYPPKPQEVLGNAAFVVPLTLASLLLLPLLRLPARIHSGGPLLLAASGPLMIGLALILTGVGYTLVEPTAPSLSLCAAGGLALMAAVRLHSVLAGLGR